MARSPCSSTRARRTARAVVMACCTAGLWVVLAGCTAAPTPTRGASPSSSPPTTSARPAAAGVAAAACGQARPITAAFPASGDLTLGALSFAGLSGDPSAPAGGPNWVPYDAHFFKSGAQLAPGATATLSIEGDATAYASIATENGSPGGALTVTYTSCPARPGITGSWWVGGILLWGRDSACVAVTYTTSADPAVARHAVIPLGASRCPAAG